MYAHIALASLIEALRLATKWEQPSYVDTFVDGSFLNRDGSISINLSHFIWSQIWALILFYFLEHHNARVEPCH